jgi:hypothetical protein
MYQKGKVPLNSLNCNIKYHFTEFNTPSGICSIKFWVFLKKRKMLRKTNIRITPVILKSDNNGVRKKHVYNRETNFFYQTWKKSQEKKKFFNYNNNYKKKKYPVWYDYYLDYINTTLNIRPQDFTEEHKSIFNEQPKSLWKK